MKCARHSVFTSRYLLLGAMTIASMVPASAVAELPLIRFDRLVPIGASAGTTVQVEQAGGDTDGVTELLFDHPGIKSEHVKDNRVFKLTIAADVPVGTYDCRLVGRFGVSNPRLFQVTHGLQDVEEKEPNNEAEQAQLVPINSATMTRCPRFASNRNQSSPFWSLIPLIAELIGTS